MSSPASPTSQPHLPVVKCVIVGDSGVGKTALLERLVEGRFNAEFKATIGAEFFSKVVPLPASDRLVQLQLWDTAGQERYRALSAVYFRGCEAAVVVVDVTSDVSFTRARYWIDEVLRGIGKTSIDGFPVLLVANKVDVDVSCWAVQKEVMEAFAHSNGLSFLMCSAKTGENVEHAFQACGAMAVDYRESLNLQQMDLNSFPAVNMNSVQQRSARRDGSSRLKCCAT